MDPKPRPNRRRYIEVLRGMTPEQRLKAFELSEFAKQLFIQGLRQRHPELNEGEFHKLMLARLENVTTGTGEAGDKDGKSKVSFGKMGP